MITLTKQIARVRFRRYGHWKGCIMRAAKRVECLIPHKVHLQGRCSASLSVVLVTALLLLNLQTIQAATFTVGGPSGCDFSIGNWTNGMKFKAGDILIFNYDPSVHNVVVVDANGYNSCTSSKVSTTYTTGKDQVKLLKGHYFFICSIPGHCDASLKIVVNAS